MLGIKADTHGAGIYAIMNLRTQRVYVGRSTNIWRRWRAHLSDLRRGRHVNGTLQAEWNATPEPFFVWVVLERSSSERGVLVEREQWWIDHTPDAMNESYDAAGGGAIPSTETRRRMRVAKLGRKMSLAHRAAISAGHRGQKFTVETRAKLSAAAKKRVRTLEHCENIRRSKLGNTFRKDHFHSLETREKISTTKRGTSWSTKRRAAFDLRKSTSLLGVANTVPPSGSMVPDSKQSIASASGKSFVS